MVESINARITRFSRLLEAGAKRRKLHLMNVDYYDTKIEMEICLYANKTNCTKLIVLIDELLATDDMSLLANQKLDLVVEQLKG